MRVSLNPQFLNYDPVCDSGINVGFNNQEQTVGPGESKNICGMQTGNMVPVSFSPLEICETTGITGCSALS